MASARRPRVSVWIRQPGWAGIWGRYTLVVSEHHGSGLDPQIESNREKGCYRNLPNIFKFSLLCPVGHGYTPGSTKA